MMIMPSIDERGRPATAIGRFGCIEALVTTDAKIHFARQIL